MKNTHPKGFMAVVALGIFALLMLFGLSLQKTTMRTYGSIKDGLNYMYAKNRADSVMEYLQFTLNKHEVGYSTGEITCAYGKYAKTNEGGQSTICKEFDWVAANEGVKDVEIRLSIKGRPEVAEKIKTAKCKSGLTDFSGSCYVAPFPGVGDAGKNCDIYKPSFNGEVGATTTVPLNLSNKIKDLDQVDYSCNWNRLTFGGSQTDRVALPLYYEGANGDLVNPYYKDDGSAKQLLLRLRTPCLPCVYGEDNLVYGANRLCENGDDTTVCTDKERYVLDDGNDKDSTKNEVVVQWQLSGKCDNGTKDCSVLPIPGDLDKSGIYEWRINDSKDNWAYKIIENKTIGNDVSVHPPIIVSFLESIPPAKLSLMTQPSLNIFLSGKLLTAEGKMVPYLEYQLLTDKPVGSPGFKLDANVTVGNNGFTKTLYKEIKKDLVDFAIQN